MAKLGTHMPLGVAVPLPLIFAQLLLMLALPVAVGMLVRLSRPALANRSQPYFRAFGFGGVAVLILLIVASDPAMFMHGLRGYRASGSDVRRRIISWRLVERHCQWRNIVGCVHAGDGVRHAEHGGGHRDRAGAGGTRRIRSVRDHLFPDRNSADVVRHRCLPPVAALAIQRQFVATMPSKVA